MTNLPVTEALIERENAAQLKKWLETRGELQYRPSRRLHGSRAIYEERRRQQPPLGPSSSLLSLKSRGSRASAGAPSPPPPIRRASAGPVPGPVVTAEGLHPSLPSPTGNSTPLGPSKETRKQEKERQKQEKEREKERQKQEKEREKQEKERQKWEKEQEKEQQKREKERQKQEKKSQGRKLSLRRKADGPPASQDGGDRASAGEARQDAYF